MSWGRDLLSPFFPAVSSGSVTVNADSSVQLLAEEAVTLDMLDLGVSRCGNRFRAGAGTAQQSPGW